MSSRKAIASGAAGRYAVALFALAEENGTESQVEADLEKLLRLLSDSAEFADLVESPILDRGAQQLGIALVAEILELDRIVGNFLGVLAANRRLAQLAAVIAGYRQLAAEKRGEVTAKVTSAAALTGGQKEELAAKLRAIAGHAVLFETDVDEDLLGGLVVRIGSKVVDSSMRTKLENLKMSMKGV